MDSGLAKLGMGAGGGDLSAKIEQGLSKVKMGRQTNTGSTGVGHTAPTPPVQVPGTKQYDPTLPTIPVPHDETVARTNPHAFDAKGTGVPHGGAFEDASPSAMAREHVPPGTSAVYPPFAGTEAPHSAASQGGTHFQQQIYTPPHNPPPANPFEDPNHPKHHREDAVTDVAR